MALPDTQILTIIPETASGTINSHVVSAIARLRHEDIEKAELLFNGTRVVLYKTSNQHDIAEKWTLKSKLESLARTE